MVAAGYKEVQVRKSNALIEAFGQPSLLATRLLYAAILHAEKRTEGGLSPYMAREDFDRVRSQTGVDFTKGLVAVFPQAEIRQLTGTHSGSYYKSLESLLNSPKTDKKKSLIGQWSLLVNSKGVKGEVALITACLYDKKSGNILIKFSDEEDLQNLVVNSKYYTSLPYERIMKFKCTYSSKLYELIKKEISYDEAVTKEIRQTYEFNYDLGKLKFLLGIISPFSSPEYVSMLSARNPDYNAIAAMAPPEDAGMVKYNDFKRFCLEKATAEITELTEFDVDFYHGKKRGLGGKIYDVTLVVKRKAEVTEEGSGQETVSKKKSSARREEDMFERMMNINDILEAEFSPDEIRQIAKAAGYDDERIRKAYQVYRTTEKVKSRVGFMIAAVQGDYHMSRGAYHPITDADLTPDGEREIRVS